MTTMNSAQQANFTIKTATSAISKIKNSDGYDLESGIEAMTNEEIVILMSHLQREQMRRIGLAG